MVCAMRRFLRRLRKAAHAGTGTVRRVEMPPAMGFETSDWRPQPSTFEGKQRIEVPFALAVLVLGPAPFRAALAYTFAY